MFWFQLFFECYHRALGQTATLNLPRGLQAILENQVTFIISIHLRTDFAGLKLREMGKKGLLLWHKIIPRGCIIFLKLPV